MDIQVSDKIINFLFFLPMFLISISVHEFSHAILAYRFGDDTARKEGRLTLNPFKHADLIGTLIVPLASYFSGFALIGWAKPVPVNRQNFSNDYRDDAIVSFAGPLSNFVLALIFLVALSIALNFYNSDSALLIDILWYGMFFNVFLFAFNLLPFPPLDGSHILYDIFPNKYTQKLLQLGFYGSIFLLVFIYSPLWQYFMKAVNFILDLLLQIGGIGHE